jgi:hypothetical protein
MVDQRVPALADQFPQIQSQVGFPSARIRRDLPPQRVLLYFDMPTQRDILARLARALAPTASLPTGSAETVIGLSEAFVPHQEHPTALCPRATQRQRPELMLVCKLAPLLLK